MQLNLEFKVIKIINQPDNPYRSHLKKKKQQTNKDSVLTQFIKVRTETKIFVVHHSTIFPLEKMEHPGLGNLNIQSDSAFN